VKYVLIGLLKAWRLMISPLYGDVCRYYPSCSAYALRAVQYHGAVRGSWMAARRLLRCHPWAAGGYDPVRGTPEFDEEMRDQRVRAATMEKSPRRSVTVAQKDGSDSDVCTGSTGQSEHAQQPHSHRTQGRKATVGQGRGLK
jgi:putative membrane protein insertion efficiency factor